MNYAAAVGDDNPRLFDTRQQQLPVHPMILAHPEWEATKLLAGALALAPEEASRAVEVTHDTRIYRPMFAGEHLETRARVIGVQRHPAGGWLTVQYDTRTLADELVATTVVGIVYRGVEVEGDDIVPQLAGAADEPADADRASVPLDFGPAACHVYSECSRIWNAIHTDIAVAEKAGLPGLILHGSATLARGVSEVVNRVLDGHPERVTRIYGEFRAMVVVPSRPTLEYGVPTDPTADVTPFSIVTPSGGLAVANGQIVHLPSV
jgi:acyl dehydratase